MRFNTPSEIAKEVFFYLISAGHFFCDSNYRLERRGFPTYLAMLVEQGSGCVEYSDRRYDASAGDIVLIDCRQAHAYYTDLGWETYWFHFEGNASSALFEMINSSQGPMLNDLGGERGTLLRRIVDRSLGDGFHHEAVVSALVHAFLAELLPLSGIDGTPGRLSPPVERVVDYIQKHYVERLGLDDLARLADLSPYHFSRVFKGETKYAPHEFLVATRLDQAKILLRSTDYSVKQVAIETGFRSETSFVTSFKKNTGFTPSAFRDISI